MNEQTIKKIIQGSWILLPFIYGGFYDWVIMLMAVIWGISLLSIAICSKKIIFPEKKICVVMAVIIASYLGTVFYGIDVGMSEIGTFRVISVIEFAILLKYINFEERTKLLKQISEIGSVMVLLSVIFYVTPWRENFYQASRLGGFFQYSNTFALYLLLGIIVLMHEKETETDWKLYGQLLLLVTGILLTGSRTIFALMGINFIWFFIREKEKRKIILVIIGWIIVLTGIGIFVIGSYQNTGRYLTIFTQNSTLWGRIIYQIDGWKMLLKRPEGSGYLGYYFLQPSLQSASYTAKFVHNDFLQTGIDAGILAMILIVILFVGNIFSKTNLNVQKHLLIVILIHSFMDFNLQFLVIDMIVIVCMQKKQSKQEILEKTKVFSLGIIILSLLFLRAGIGLFMEYQGNYKKAIRYMPELTTARIQQLLCETNEKDAKKWADELIRSNENISEAYGIKAEIAYENKHYEEMIRYKRKEIRNRKYQKEVYEDYIEKLAEILEKEQQTSDMKEIQRYLKELVWIQGYIEKINKHTNPIAIHLKDDSKIKLDDNYQNYLNEIDDYYNRHY